MGHTKYSLEDAKELLNRLNTIIETGKPFSFDSGLCFNISAGRCHGTGENDDRYIYGYPIVESFSPEWEHFSGDCSYPIPQWASIGSTSYWCWNGELGRLRLSLAVFVADKLRRKLEEAEANNADCVKIPYPW